MRFFHGGAAVVRQAEPVGEVPLGLTAHLGPPRPTAAIGRRSWWRRHRTLIATAAGLVCAFAGVVVTAAPGRDAVYIDTAGYHVGSNLLRAVGSGRYESSGAVLVSRQLPGAYNAASSMDINGVHVVSACRVDHTYEYCRFTLGDRKVLTAEDALVSTGDGTWWERHYSDGGRVRIELRSGTAVPVPVLLGR